MPEVPEAVLEQVLAAMAGEIIEKTLEKVAEEIPGILAGIGERKGGLIPCGRTSDNPDTPWDETESCGIKHIFIMLKLIINFLLFKLAPIALILLAAASGVIFYFSLKMGAADPLIRIKSLWKAAGIGFGILLFSWVIINLIITSAGYQLGPWWQL